MATPTGNLMWVTLICRCVNLYGLQDHDETLRRQPVQHPCCRKKNNPKLIALGAPIWRIPETACQPGTHVQVRGHVHPVMWGEISPHRNAGQANVNPKRSEAAIKHHRYRFMAEGKHAVATLQAAHANQNQLLIVEGQITASRCILIGDVRPVSRQEAVGAVMRQAIEGESESG